MVESSGQLSKVIYGKFLFSFVGVVKMLKKTYFCGIKLSRGVIGNTSDSGSEEFRFET